MRILNKYKSLIKKAQEKKEKNIELEFNFFTSISDYYYRENFHSDILKTLLSILEFFNTFISELSKHIGFEIDFSFDSTVIGRERHGRIDISIIDNEKNQAIIIENKINDAVDMKRQLPKYNENLSNKGIEVLNILYLSINGNKNPTKLDWTSEDKIKIENKITIMSGIERENFFNIEVIINKSIIKTTNINHIVFQKQYKNLLNKIDAENINLYVMNELYSKIKSKGDLDELLTLKNLINELPNYRAIKIKEHFKNNSSPFTSVQIHRNYTTYFNKLTFLESDFAIDIDCNEKNYEVSFFDRNAETNETVKLFLEKTDLDFFEREASSRLFKLFQYPEQENDLYEFIKEAKNKIEKILKEKDNLT